MLVVKARGVVVIEKRPEVLYYQPETMKVKIGLQHVPRQTIHMTAADVRLQNALLAK